MTNEARHDPRPAEEPGPAPPGVAPAEEPGPAPPGVAPVVVPRWIQLVLLPLSVLALYALATAAGGVLLVFLVASVIALILNPLVKLVERTHLRHGLSVLAVYLGFFGVLAGGVVLLIDPASQQVETFQRDVPSLVRDANRSLAHVQDYLDRKGINVRVKEQGQTALETIQKRVLHGSGDVVAFTRDLVQRLIEGAFAFVLVLVISVYMLLYAEGSGGLVRRLMPPGDGSPEDDFPLRAQKAVFLLRAGAGPVLADHGHDSGRAVDLRAAGDLPRRAHVRPRLRGVLRGWSSCPTSARSSARCRPCSSCCSETR